MSRTMRSCLAITAIGCLVLAAAPARAQSGSDAEAKYVRDHMAVRAADRCGGNFDQAKHDRIAAVIREKSGLSMGAGQLSLLHKGSTKASHLISARHCVHDDVKDLIAIFESEIAPSL